MRKGSRVRARIFSHTPAYVETQLSHYAFAHLKTQKCFVGDDQFILWIVGKR